VLVVVELDGLFDRGMNPTRQDKQAPGKEERHPEEKISVQDRVTPRKSGWRID
jgi:hypothetical protein